MPTNPPLVARGKSGNTKSILMASPDLPTDAEIGSLGTAVFVGFSSLAGACACARWTSLTHTLNST